MQVCWERSGWQCIGGEFLGEVHADPAESMDLAKVDPQRLQALMQEMVARLESQGAQYPVHADGTTTGPPVLPPADSSEQ